MIIFKTFKLPDGTPIDIREDRIDAFHELKRTGYTLLILSSGREVDVLETVVEVKKRLAEQ